MKTNVKKLILASITTLVAIPSITFSLSTLIKADEKRAKLALAAELDTYYSGIDTSNASNLFNGLVELTSHNVTMSYDGLWTVYNSAYIRDDGKIFDYYSNTTNYTPGSGQCGNYSGEGSCYNREHSIPKSWWGGAKSSQGADPFIVVPSDGFVNGKRSNYAFGNVGSVTYASKNNFSLLGTSDGTAGITGTVFEPNDSVKGDFARIYFYAATKYHLNGADKGKVSNWTSGDGSVFFSSSGTYNLTNKALTLFQDWMEIDPVDEWELSVNEGVYEHFGIRNPYINHPEYIDLIWYGKSIETKTLSSISITGTASKKSYYVGDTFDPTGLTVTATYSDSSTENVTNKVTWSPANLSANTTSITASYTYGSVTKTAIYTNFTVTENTRVLSSLTVTGSPNKTSYYVGDTFNPTGLTVTATYSDSTTENVTNIVAWTPNPLTLGTTTVTGSYDGKTVTISGISVTSKPVEQGTTVSFVFSEIYNTDTTLTDVEINKDPISVSFIKNSGSTDPKYYSNGTAARIYANNSFTVSSTASNITKIQLVYGSSDGSNEITTDVNTFSGDTWTGSSQNVTFTVGGSSGHRRISKIIVTYGSEIIEPTPTVNLTSISINDISSTYYVGETLDINQIIATANYSDGSKKTIDPNELIITSEENIITYDDDREGYKTYNASYTENDVTVETTFKLTNIERKAYIPPKTTTSTSEINIDFSAKNYSNGQEITSCKQDGVTVSFNKGTNTNTPKYYTSGTAVRVYGGGYFTINAASEISKVVITYGTGGDSNEITANPGSFSSNTWTGSSQNVTFTVGGTSGHRRIKELAITLATNGDTVESDNALNIANYIMNEDTDGQCNEKFSVAKEKILGLTSEELKMFKASNDYVISCARERYIKWATALNQNAYTAGSINSNALIKIDNNNSIIIIISSCVSISLLAIALYILLRKKYEK